MTPPNPTASLTALPTSEFSGLIAPAIGTYIVQRKMSLLGDGLGRAQQINLLALPLLGLLAWNLAVLLLVAARALRPRGGVSVAGLGVARLGAWLARRGAGQG